MKIVTVFLLCAYIYIAEAFQPDYLSPLEGKLQGGIDVDHKKLNFMASLHHLAHFLCHSFLINFKHALTTAHCVRMFFSLEPPPNFKEYELIVHGDSSTCMKTNYKIEQIETIKQFDPSKTSIGSDFAIITLRSNVTEECGAWLNIGDDPEYEPKIRTETSAIGWRSYNVENEQSDTGDRMLKCMTAITIPAKFCSRASNIAFICVAASGIFDKQDMGTPLILKGKAVGVHSSLYSMQGSIAIYVNIYKRAKEIKHMLQFSRKYTPLSAPRFFARYDWKNNYI